MYGNAPGTQVLPGLSQVAPLIHPLQIGIAFKFSSTLMPTARSNGLHPSAASAYKSSISSSLPSFSSFFNLLIQFLCLSLSFFAFPNITCNPFFPNDFRISCTFHRLLVLRLYNKNIHHTLLYFININVFFHCTGKH